MSEFVAKQLENRFRDPGDRMRFHAVLPPKHTQCRRCRGLGTGNLRPWLDGRLTTAFGLGFSFISLSLPCFVPKTADRETNQRPDAQMVRIEEDRRSGTPDKATARRSERRLSSAKGLQVSIAAHQGSLCYGLAGSLALVRASAQRRTNSNAAILRDSPRPPDSLWYASFGPMCTVH